MNRYFLIKFEDLTNEKQEKIKTELAEQIKAEVGDNLAKLVAEQYDFARETIPETLIDGAIERACNKFWAEVGFSVEL